MGVTAVAPTMSLSPANRTERANLGGAPLEDVIRRAAPCIIDLNTWRRTRVRPSPVASNPLKRAADVMLGVTLLIISAPLLLASMLIIKLTSEGPALFVHHRVGYRYRPFRMYKLRTMRNGAEADEGPLASGTGRVFFKLENDPRTTPVGRWLRKYSIDEIPQLWNVVRGDMSLIGPRPMLASDFENFPRQTPWHRFSVRPGMTGLWQVSGRSRLSDEQRIALDLEYVERWSLALDLAILWRTLPVVVRGDGAR